MTRKGKQKVDIGVCYDNVLTASEPLLGPPEEGRHRLNADESRVSGVHSRTHSDYTGLKEAVEVFDGDGG